MRVPMTDDEQSAKGFTLQVGLKLKQAQIGINKKAVCSSFNQLLPVPNNSRQLRTWKLSITELSELCNDHKPQR